MPSSCDHGNSGNYAVRHNPAVYYTTLHGCSGNDVPFSDLATDLAHNQLPAFSFVTPNLIDDTAEQLLGLAKLGQAASSTTMTKAFNL